MSHLQSRYIEQLMKQADRRNKEHEIVYERKLAKEREKDEHLFSGKEKFITGAYKRKLEEQKKWLAEERLRELREEKDDVSSLFSCLTRSRTLVFSCFFVLAMMRRY